MAEELDSQERSRLLRQLSEDVSRIAGSLARLSIGTDHADPPFATNSNEISVEPDSVHWLIQARRSRGKYVCSDLLSDPGWDILLDLLQAELQHQRVSVSSASLAGGVPATTGLRWLKVLEQRGLVTRTLDPRDGRRIFVSLSPEASQMLRRYIAEVLERRISGAR